MKLHLFQLVRFRTVLIQISILPVRKSKRPNSQHRIHIVTNPCVLISCAGVGRKEAGDGVLVGEYGSVNYALVVVETNAGVTSGAKFEAGCAAHRLGRARGEHGGVGVHDGLFAGGGCRERHLARLNTKYCTNTVTSAS